MIVEEPGKKKTCDAEEPHPTGHVEKLRLGLLLSLVGMV